MRTERASVAEHPPLVPQAIAWPPHGDRAGGSRPARAGTRADPATAGLAVDGAAIRRPHADYFCIHGGELGADGFEPFARPPRGTASRRAKDPLALAARQPHRGNRRGAVVRSRRAAASWTSAAFRRPTSGRSAPRPRRVGRGPRPGRLVEGAPRCDGAAWPAVPSAAADCGTCSTRSSVPPTPSGCGWRPCPIRKRPADAWWRSRAGVKEFMYAWLELVYAWAEGDDPARSPRAPPRFSRKSAQNRRGAPMKCPQSPLVADRGRRRHPDSRRSR